MSKIALELRVRNVNFLVVDNLIVCVEWSIIVKLNFLLLFSFVRLHIFRAKG